MSLLTYIVPLLALVMLIMPYFICVILKFALWKYHFTSKPTRLFSVFSY